MTIYEEYKKKYDEIAENSNDEYIIKDYIWITMQFLTDRNVDPWEKDKMQLIFEEWKEKSEQSFC